MPHNSTHEAAEPVAVPAAASVADPKPPRPAESDPEPAVCPFCGACGEIVGSERCGACGAFTDPLSRQATQNEMGPWFIRDADHPFRPGCRLETLERMVRSGKITTDTVLRGPTTHQNWTRADRVPGVARLLGRCHACHGEVGVQEVICRSCGTGLTAERDRQHLGLSPVRAIPGRARPAEIARALVEPERTVPGPARPAMPVHAPLPDAGPPARSAPAAVFAGGTPNLAPPVPASAGRADRRLRAARARASVAVMLAVLFAALFAFSMFMGGSFGFAPESDPPAGISQDATPEVADDIMD